MCLSGCLVNQTKLLLTDTTSGTMTGNTSPAGILFLCPTNGSIPGLQPGTLLFMQHPLFTSTRILQSSNYQLYSGNIICILTDKFPPMNGILAMSIPRYMPGEFGMCMKQTEKKRV